MGGCGSTPQKEVPPPSPPKLPEAQPPVTQPSLPEGQHQPDLTKENTSSTLAIGSLDASHIASPAVTETHHAEVSHDEDGNKIINQYALVSQLGQGAYAKVKLVVHIESEKAYALKILNKSLLGRVKKAGGDGTAMTDVRREIAIMKALSHRNIVNLHEVIDDPDMDKLYLIMDYMQKGPLGEIKEDGNLDREPLSMKTLAGYAQELMTGLSYLHFQKIVHRDIKPENVLLDSQDVPKLADFGVSHTRTASDDDEAPTATGTPAFLSPEACNLGISAEPGDIWAMGITFYVLAFGKLPYFHASDHRELSRMISNDPLVFPDDADANFKDLVSNMLIKDPSKRFGTRDILEHPFVTGHGEVKGEAEKFQEINLTGADLSSAIAVGSNVQLKDQVMLLAKIKGKFGKHHKKAAEDAPAAAAEPNSAGEGAAAAGAEAPTGDGAAVATN